MTRVKQGIINNQMFTITQGNTVLQKNVECPVNQEQKETS